MLKSVFVEITRECNLDCVFCSNESRAPFSDELTYDEYVALLESLHKMGAKNLKLYGGEPFLRPHVFSVINKANSLGMSVNIYSNGTILDKKILKQVKDSCVQKLSLSVDGSSPEIHDNIRGTAGSFHEVIKNIQTLVESGIMVDVLITVCRLNKDDIAGIYRLVHSLGVHDVKANFVARVGRAKKRWDKLSMNTDEVRECVHRISSIHSELFHRIPIRQTCQAGTEEVFIASNGDVYPCALFLEPAYMAGNIRKNNIQEIWSNPNGFLTAIREVVSKQQFCPSCEKKQICGGGCRARAAALHNGNLLVPDTSSCVLHKEVLK